MFSNNVITDLIKRYGDGISIQELAKWLNCSDTTIRTYLHKNDVEIRRPKLMNDDLINTIVGQYQSGISARRVARINQIALGRVSDVLYKNEIPMRHRRFYIDESFFEVIDTEEKAYILGFIYADGCVIYDEEKRCYCIAIGLKRGDRGQLENIAKALKTNYEIKDVINKSGFGGPSCCCRLRIFSKKMVKDIINKGCLPNKTYIDYNWPSTNIVPKHLIRHFLRGTVDGDGTIMNHSKWPAFSLLASRRFCIGAQKWLMKMCNLRKTKITQRGVIYHFKYGGRHQFRRITNVLYNNNTISLARKQAIFNGIG